MTSPQVPGGGMLTSGGSTIPVRLLKIDRTFTGRNKRVRERSHDYSYT
jgi:hypothetical protein